MKQLSIFSMPDQNQSHTSHAWTIYIDGASRNNPGHAGAGIVIMKDNVIIQEEGYYLGKRTNNQAEYLAFLLGIFLVKQLMHKMDTLHIISDSELLVRQLTGHYKVKDPELKKLFGMVQAELAGVSFRIQHVLREHNKLADKMANKGLETRHAVPDTFVQMLAQHTIAW